MNSDGIYDSRKEQVEAFADLVRAGDMSCDDALKDACFVGACEERDHCLEIIRSCPGLVADNKRALVERICAKSVLEVLGYSEE